MMGQVKSLDHLNTGMIQSRGWKLDKVFPDDSGDTLKTHDETMVYAEKLAEEKDEVDFSR